MTPQINTWLAATLVLTAMDSLLAFVALAAATLWLLNDRIGGT